MPQTFDQLWQYFAERDAVIFAIVAPLVLIAWLVATRLIEYEDYFTEHVPAKRDFEAWKAKRSKRHLCPKDNIVLMRGSCPICGWRPPQ
jgi:hypothetical protein